jgi:hypothetical protein
MLYFLSVGNLIIIIRNGFTLKSPVILHQSHQLRIENYSLLSHISFTKKCF